MRVTILIISSLFIGVFVTVSNAQRFSPSSVISVPGFSGTKVYPGDFDNDGDDDILISGNELNTPILKLYETNNGFLYEKANSGLPQEAAANAVWVDYDHDMDLDVFIYNSDWKISSASFYINSNGAFTRLSVSLPKLSFANFSVVDYNQDGDIDLLMIGEDEARQTKSYLLKNSPNGFITIPAPFVGSNEGNFAWADFDKDNDLDVIISSYYSSILYTNDGQDSFTAFKSDFPGSVRGQIQWADFDKDDDSDLLITGFSAGGSSSEIFINNSNETFSIYAGVDLVGTEQGNSQWIDYDNDGDLDLFHSGYADGVFIKQLFEFNSSVYTEVIDLGFNVLYDTEFTGIAFFDYDKDGDYDGLVLNDSYKTRIFRNNLGANPYPLDRKPATPVSLIAHPINTTTIQLDWLDFNSNEDYFSVEMSQSPSGPFMEVAVVSGTVSGSSTYSYVSTQVSGLTGGIQYSFRVRARSNSFGNSDYSNQVISYVASPDLVPTSANPIYYPYKSSWADIDNDGDLDIIYSGFSNPDDNYAPKTIILKNTAGGLSIQTHNLPQIVGYDIDWADYDLDGDLDLLLSGTTPPPSGLARTKLMLNEGNFTFTEYTQTALLGVRSGFARWVDVNGDGYMDIYASGTLDGNNTVHSSQLMVNNRDNTFVEKVNSGLPALYQSELEINDFNNDGFPDFLLCGLKDTVNNYFIAKSELYLNDGYGTFKFHQKFMDSFEGSVRSADFDLDGDADIIVSGNQNATRIYWNQNGKFQTDANNQLPGFQDGELAVGDIDNDGDTDIIFGGGTDRVKLARIFLNNGQGIFSEGYYGLTRTASLFSVGDLDQDEDLDLFETSINGPFNLFKNQHVGVNSKPNAPTLSKVEPVAGGVKIIWQRGADDKTPSSSLTSNVFVKDADGKYYFNSHADVTTGRLKKPAFGNVFLSDSIVLQNLVPGDYTIGVQNIDNSFSASPFTITNVMIPYLAPSLVNTPMVCENSSAEIKVLGNSIVWYKDESLITPIGQGNTFRPMMRQSDSTFYAVQETAGIKSSALQVIVKVVHKVKGSIIIDGDSLVAPLAEYYQWYKDGIKLNGQVKRKLLVTGIGIYTLYASNNPCSAQTISYSVKPDSPTVQFTPQLCVGQPQSLVALGNDIKWYDVSGSIIASGSILLIPAVDLSDTEVFSTQVVNSIESDKVRVSWKVYAFPGKTIIQENGVLMAPEGESYQWYRNDNEIQGAINRELSTIDDGVYHVVTKNYTCATISDKIIYTGIEGPENDQYIFQRMPDGKVIVGAGNQIVREIIIYDFLGRKVRQFSTPEKINGFYELDTSLLEIGVYLVYVDCDIPIQGRVIKW